MLLVIGGALTGLHAATWGAYKDERFEGFRPASFVRSPALGALVGLAFWIAGLEAVHVVGVAGLLYTAERLLTEGWKTIVRVDDQSAYDIPMRLAVRGVPVDDGRVRYAVGLGITVGFVAAVLAVDALQSVVPAVPWWVVLLGGGLGGWLTAIGGAWKDAPIEGFELAKFFRSPVVATCWAAMVMHLADSWVVIVLASGGLSVATIETYKTFLTGDRPPGKFAGKPATPARPRLMDVLAAAFASLWLAFAVAALLAPGSAVAGGAVAVVAGLLGSAVAVGHRRTSRLRAAAPSANRVADPAR